MKRSIRLVAGVVLGALVLTMTGCEDDLVQNPDFINPDTFYKNNQELQRGVNGVYANLGGENGGGEGRWFNWFYDRYVFEERVGYQVGWEKGPLDFQTGQETPSDPYIQAFWEISYQSINRANGAIEAARQLEGQTNDEDKRARLLAEAQFLRGFYYYYLAEYFTDDQQGVPLTLERTTDTENPGTASRSDILQRVIQDASAAASDLKSTYEGANKGRATKWAAKTLLMKAHLAQENWQEAANVAEDIMNNSPHGFYSDFSNNWAKDHENEYTGGRIFEGQVSASAEANQYSNHHAHFVPPDHEFGQGWHWLWVTKDYRMRYDASDNRIPGTFLQSYRSNRPCDPNAGECDTQEARSSSFHKVEWDPNANFSLGRFGGVVADQANPNNPDELKYGGGWSRKWVEDCGGRACWPTTEKNIPYFRYSDVVLGHVEACLEGASCNPQTSFDKLRTQRGLSSKPATMENLIEEWMKEFTFEQKGFIFLKRKSSHGGGGTDYLGQWINDFVNTYDVDRSHREKDHIIPIPQSEVNANPNVKQHPIWR